MNRTLSLCALAALTALCAPARALDIKGLALGQSIDCVALRASDPTVIGCGADFVGWQTTLAGDRSTIGAILDAQSRMTWIDASIADFPGALEALAQKWGTPACVDKPVTNGFGVKATRTACVWIDGDARLTLVRNNGKLGKHTLTLESQAAREAALAASRAKAASDL